MDNLKNYICINGKIVHKDSIECECYDTANNQCPLRSCLILSKGIHKRLYACRDLELNSLWTRACFLWGMIALAFSGYGVFLLNDNKSICPASINGKIIGLLLGIVIYILGLLAVFMAKGSKFWYEVYEEKIDFIENNCLKKSIPQVLRNNVVSKEKAGWNFLAATRFSPSRINIIHGYVICLIGFILILAHSIYLFIGFSPKYLFEQIATTYCPLTLLLICDILACLVSGVILYWLSKGKKDR